ncbi:molybdenum cofactor biosynthesis protein 1 [Colias croceus]|uniref:molybdenum cofactor biosynthesis protein 1 n=1 Tax=Colias crocea TaxID=72248 RepID=UPI001E27F912|nr:molybdenum cofactor biosynthesis protein 1 [Colias croceus]XP_045499016.1 molybdenum cofactor biosynthesis protein 1 [Colias croceus]
MNLVKQTQFFAPLYTIGINARPHLTKKSVAFQYKRFFSDNVEGQSKSNKEPPLMDLHGRRHDYLRISLTERCNLRCQYCMPAEGVPLSARSALLTRAELARLVRVFAALGVTKLRLTGGEPTVRQDLVDIIQELAGVEGIATVAMTSNGVALTRRLPALQRAGLAALNVSLDSLRAERYERMARRPGLQKVLACIDLALQLGFSPVKVNTVLMKGFNDDEVCDFVEFTKDRNVEVRFIEFMPFTGNRWDDSRMVAGAAALAAARAALPALRPAPPAPCRTATVWKADGYAGSVGFISSMTQPFCSSCNRLRLTADGNLKVCLFGGAEVSLRDAVRAGAGDGDLAALVRAALRRKLPQHAGAVRGGAWGARGAGRALRAARGYCTLSHLDERGRARMVDVGAKPVRARAAEAECFLQVSARLLRLLRDAAVPKGDALSVAQVAGTLAAKRTADLIPMCHPLPLELARVRVELPREAGAASEAGGRVRLTCEARATARTGVEMEALTGCAVAALALYDMCKSVDKHMTITGLRVLRKSGGVGGDWAVSTAPRPHDQQAPHTAHDQHMPHETSEQTPAKAKTETYAPTNFMHL